MPKDAAKKSSSKSKTGEKKKSSPSPKPKPSGKPPRSPSPAPKPPTATETSITAPEVKPPAPVAGSPGASIPAPAPYSYPPPAGNGSPFTGYGFSSQSPPTAPFYSTIVNPASPAPPALPSVYFGAYAYAHDMTGAYHSRYGSLASIDAQLIAKREKILSQMAKVQGAMEAVQAARRGIERETMADAEGIIHRLRSAEAVKMSVLQHDLDTLRADASSIDGFHAAFAQFCPSSVWSPADARFDSSEHAMQFIAAYPQLSAEAERLAGKPLKAVVDITPDDFPRETAVRQESLLRFDAMSELVAAKDKMIWKLMKEREAGAADMEALAKASANELGEWKKFGDQLAARLDSLSLVCAYCSTRLDPTAVNSDCPVNTPANASAIRPPSAGEGGGDGPVAQVGSRRHFFMHVSASTERA